MQTPEWALELVERVAALEGRNPPTVRWRQTRHWYSSGRFRYKSQELLLSAGISLEDQQMVLLHELGHFIRGRRQRPPGKRRMPSHDRRFWEITWRLYEQHGDPHWAWMREKEFVKARTYAPTWLREQVG